MPKAYIAVSYLGVPMSKPWDILPRPASGGTEDDIHLRVGRALSEWERLEYRLSLIYCDLVSPKRMSLPAMRSFGSGPTSFTRLEMLKEAVAVYDFGRDEADLKKRLLDFIREVVNFAKRRNDIAHGVTVNPKIDGARVGHVLMPAFYNAKRFDPKNMFKADYMFGLAELDHYVGHFVRLKAEAENLLEQVKALPDPFS